MTKVSLEVVNFKQEMARIEAEVAALANLEITALVKYGTEQLRVVTPVDEGNARAGWENTIYRSFRGSFIGATIYNEVEYIDRLNQGHSQQAPSYFIEQTLSKIGLITPV
jgi:hypothetical protein